MVQVDVFWSYAIGASFAAGAARQLKDEPNTFQNPYFTKTLLFLSIFFAPSGVVLLWAFTGWETMYLWDRSTLPGWIVPIFGITNITQGIIGFWVAHKLIRSGKYFWAHAQWVFGYLAMFFILVHGWDGIGYRRFFTYTDHQTAQVLAEGFGPWIALKWMFSPVALTLYGMGVIMLPVMFLWIARPAKEGYRLGGVDREQAAQTSVGGIIKAFARGVFLGTLTSAILWSLLIHLTNCCIGTLIFIPLFAFFGLGPIGLIRKDINKITLESSGGSGPVGVAVPAGQ